MRKFLHCEGKAAKMPDNTPNPAEMGRPIREVGVGGKGPCTDGLMRWGKLKPGRTLVHPRGFGEAPVARWGEPDDGRMLRGAVAESAEGPGWFLTGRC